MAEGAWCILSTLGAGGGVGGGVGPCAATQFLHEHQQGQQLLQCHKEPCGACGGLRVDKCPPPPPLPWVGLLTSVPPQPTPEEVRDLTKIRACYCLLLPAAACSAHYRGGETFGRGEFRGAYFAVKKSGEISPPAKVSRRVTNIFSANSDAGA